MKRAWEVVIRAITISVKFPSKLTTYLVIGIREVAVKLIFIIFNFVDVHVETRV